MGHADRIDTLLSKLGVVIEFFYPVRVLKRSNGIHEIDAMLTAIQRVLGIVPIIVHGEFRLPDSGSRRNPHVNGWPVVDR